MGVFYLAKKQYLRNYTYKNRQNLKQTIKIQQSQINLQKGIDKRDKI